MENELYHHGILGQKWGVRNGPPYPLDAKDHSSSEKKAGWKKSLRNDPDLAEKRSTVRRARKEYNRAYNNWYNRSMAGLSPVKAHRDANTARYEEAVRKAEAYKNARKDYKNAKRAAKQTLDKVGHRSMSDDSRTESKSNLHLQSVLGVTDEEAASIKKWAKIAGISLATTAGIAAAGYFLCKSKGANLHNISVGYNKDFRNLRNTLALKDVLSNSANGDYIGAMAKSHGYRELSMESLRAALTSKNSGAIDYNQLIRNVRLNQISTDATRRLSCWSTSEAYWLSALTGHEFCSKSFQNLVEFNDFGKLYKAPIRIFNATGNEVKDFVGRMGPKYAQAGYEDADDLVRSIFKNISSANNLTADGTRTVGFINAAYHGETCTHQWNFELLHNMDGTKGLVISDGYTGFRGLVASMSTDGSVKQSAGFIKLVKNLEHYNSESLRFYAPSLDSIDLEMMSKVILGKL